MLYSADLFEPLADEAWDETRVRRRIREIVADADRALRGPRRLWQADAWDGWRQTSPMKNLYVGAAGVLWGLDRLRRRGHAETRLDLSRLAAATIDAFRARPDFMRGVPLPARRESSLGCGLAGILFVAWRLAGDRALADALYPLVRANVDNEAEEVMWGAAGTLLLARALADDTGEERWRALRDETATALSSRRRDDGLWLQRLYGDEHAGLQAWHGLVGNVAALAPVLEPARRSRLLADTVAVLERTAVHEEGLANWPYAEGQQLRSPDGQIRLQFCCGAPGIVAASADYLPEELLLAGAELAWRAGPSGAEKGPSICHGTAGTGYAFLKVFPRTGDELWLERARRFAVGALAQVERRGRGRHSLWTGDVGVALFAADCVDGRGELPVFEAR